MTVFCAVVLCDLRLAGSEGECGEVYAVGTHVGDASALIEALRHHHRLRHGESQFACGFLLQGGSGERRCGLSLERFLDDAAHGEMGGLALFEKGFHLVVGLEAMVQFGLQARSSCHRAR